MPELEPITREEMLLDGEDLTPITRKEQFIKRIYDKTQEIPEPITREEMFLKKAGEGGGGDIDLQTLNVTENGTVNAPSGVAYNKVVTNVPLPENAYLLKEVANLPQPIASFSAGTANPLKSLTVSIEPVQAGSGDPSPTNVRPISGWSGANVTNCGLNVWDEEWEVGGLDPSTGQTTSDSNRIRSKNPIKVNPSTSYYAYAGGMSSNDFRIYYYDANSNFISVGSWQYSDTFTTPNNCYYIKFVRVNTNTYNNDISINYPSTDTTYHAYAGTTTTIPFVDGQGQSVEVFGGSVDVVNGGEQPRTLGKITFDGSSDENWVVQGTAGFFIDVSDKKAGMGNYIANNYKATNSSGWDDRTPINNFSGHPILSRLYFRYPYEGFSADLTAWRTWLASNNVTVVYELATPTTFYTHPTSINSLDGENNLWASTGQIETLEFFTKEA